MSGASWKGPEGGLWASWASPPPRDSPTSTHPTPFPSPPHPPGVHQGQPRKGIKIESVICIESRTTMRLCSKRVNDASSDSIPRDDSRLGAATVHDAACAFHTYTSHRTQSMPGKGARSNIIQQVRLKRSRTIAVLAAEQNCMTLNS